MRDSSEEHAKAMAAREKAQVLEDYFNALAGRKTGRITRNFTHQPDLDENGRPKNKNDLTNIILSAEQYAAYHGYLTEFAGDTRDKADGVSVKIKTAMAVVEKRLRDGLDNAVTLPDGRKAFLDIETGIAWADDGSRLDDALTAGIDWQGKTTLQEHQKNKDDLETLRGYHERTNAIVLDIGDIENILDDTKKGGLSRDDMNAIEDRIKSNEEELDLINKDLQQYTTPVAPASEKTAPETGITNILMPPQN